jgi:hypothetical protein
MSSTAPNLAQALYNEFTLMNNQVYPYVPSGTRTSTILNIYNTSWLTSLVITPETELRFDDGAGYIYPYVFYPHISSSVTIPAAFSEQFIFETNSTGVTIPDTANMKLYKEGALVTSVSLARTEIVDAANETLYYFVYRMTQIFMDRINAANIYDPDSGDTQGAGYLDVTFDDLNNALAYAWPNILQMQTDPKNSHIINSIDTYLDKLTHRYFYGARTYQPHPVRTMTEDACDDLDEIDLSTTPDAATQLSAEMMADIVDYYCNGELS